VDRPGLAQSGPEAQQSNRHGHNAQLPVLDHEEGLRLAAGKADLAADMLAMLLASLEADREAIRQAREANDNNALIERVHRLHGATRYCGVPQLRAACQRAETCSSRMTPRPWLPWMNWTWPSPALPARPGSTPDAEQHAQRQ
jgi:two-component system, NarL family, sensor histidine kinase BarA